MTFWDFADRHIFAIVIIVIVVACALADAASSLANRK